MDDLQKALDRIGYFLAARDHSEQELKAKLARKFSETVIERALTIAHERNWLVEPARLSRQLADELTRKRKSHLYIQGQLRKRGLPPVERDVDFELKKIRQLVSKKFDSDLTFEEKAKAFRFLKYRGFDDSLIRKVLNEKLDE